jgi:antitoxin component YwqK of YwqJK toxin-antitoxin module
LASVEEKKVIYWKNGKKRKVTTRRLGRLEGPQYEYYSNGKLKSIHNYYHDRKTGWQYEYYPNGLKKNWRYLAGGKIWEMMMWNDKGKMIYYYIKEMEEKKNQ